MDIYLTDLETGDRMRFPMLPQSINVQTGAIFQSYTILAVGDVKLPAGEELTGFSWDGILPGEARKNEPYVREWRDPKSIQSQWSVYRHKKKKLRLLVTETPINHDVYIGNYTVKYKDGYGDYYYTLPFIQAKDLKVQVSTAASATATTASSAAPPRPEPPPAKTHTVVSGDTLWGIAQKYYGKGTEYTKIYNANKDLIENTAKKRGMRNSDNGHWIFPGTVLAIP
jgi:nucleoid-associated protein YgaU